MREYGGRRFRQPEKYAGQPQNIRQEQLRPIRLNDAALFLGRPQQLSKAHFRADLL